MQLPDSSDPPRRGDVDSFADPGDDNPSGLGGTAPLRVLIISHLHGRLSKGDAETAAYQMYKELSGRDDIAAYFLAASGGMMDGPLGVNIFQPFDEREFVSSSHGYDDFVHSNADLNFLKDFDRLLRELKPQIVHFHHYKNLGVEAFSYVKRSLPDSKVVVTLHDFLAICNQSEMVKPPNLSLCDQSDPRECVRCFPERSEQAFFLRRLYIQKFFGHVDQFIATSMFLARRYMAWGVAEERISVFENCLPDTVQDELVAPPASRDLRVGFFGSLSPSRGAAVLLESADILSRALEGDTPIRINVHGDAPDLAAGALMAPTDGATRNILRFRGPFEPQEMGRLIQECHAILVPSISWESSPMVIQQALALRRPVLCSDIGGMAEKVRDGVDGFHFHRGSGASLADLLLDLAAHPQRLSDLQKGMSSARPGPATTADNLLALYRNLLLQNPRNLSVPQMSGEG